MTTATEPIRQPPPHLVAAQQKHSRDKRLRVRAVLQAMIDEDAIITFAEVARRAGVSRSLVYTRGIREDIEIGRAQSARPNNRPAAAPVPRSEVLLLKKRDDKLRSEVADLRRALREKLGEKSNSVTQSRCGAKSMNSSTITTPCDSGSASSIRSWTPNAPSASSLRTR